jgi:hypothetical protein
MARVSMSRRGPREGGKTLSDMLSDNGELAEEFPLLRGYVVEIDAGDHHTIVVRSYVPVFSPRTVVMVKGSHQIPVYRENLDGTLSRKIDECKLTDRFADRRRSQAVALPKGRYDKRIGNNPDLIEIAPGL